MRLFFASFVPEEIARQLAEAQKALKGAWKPTRPDQMHVTLLFLGNVAEGELGRIQGVGRDVAAEVAPFTARIKGTGYFPPAGAPRVWFAKAEGEGFFELAEKLRLALPEFDDGKPFKAHVTLARKKGPAPRVPPVIFDATYPVRRFHLVQSRLEKTGPRYTILESFDLKGAKT